MALGSDPESGLTSCATAGGSFSSRASAGRQNRVCHLGLAKTDKGGVLTPTPRDLQTRRSLSGPDVTGVATFLAPGVCDGLYHCLHFIERETEAQVQGQAVRGGAQIPSTQPAMPATTPCCQKPAAPAPGRRQGACVPGVARGSEAPRAPCSKPQSSGPTSRA